MNQVYPSPKFEDICFKCDSKYSYMEKVLKFDCLGRFLVHELYTCTQWWFFLLKQFIMEKKCTFSKSVKK